MAHQPEVPADSTPEDLNRIVSQAQEAFATYRIAPPQVRGALLRSIADRVNRKRTWLREMAERETSLPPARLETEINRTIGHLQLFADLTEEGSWVRAIIDRADPARQPLPKPDLRQMQQPIGPVAVFGASNFPFAYSVLGGDSVAALAAGCTVVYKVNPGHPRTSGACFDLVQAALADASLPAGVFGIIYGASHQTGQDLVKHPQIRAVAFTGSFRGGMALYKAAASRPEPIPVYAEMGSINPVFLLPDIVREKGKEIARMLAASNTSSVGQFCTNPGVVIAGETGAVSSYLTEFAHMIRVSKGAPMLHAGILSAFRAGVARLQEKKEVRAEAEGEPGPADWARPVMFQTSGTAFLEDSELWEELFGPSSIQVVAEDPDTMRRIAERIPGQLTATIWGTEDDLDRHRDLIDILEQKAGRVVINGVPTGVEVSPAMNHGGPFPATTDSKFSSVGTQSIYRFTRPVCYQNYPQHLLPAELRDGNPRGIWRLIGRQYTKDE